MLYETIIPASGSSFTKKNFIFKHFPPDWHYHPEYELVAITEGVGKRFVGNGVSEFSPGDIAFIGSNVPHFHLSDRVYYENNDLYCCSEVIQFNQNIFPADFRTMPEFGPIVRLLDESSRGLLFHNDEVLERIRTRLSDFERLDGLKRLMELYRILGMLSQTPDFSYLSIAEVDYNRVKDLHNLPVYRAYQYLANNFKEPVTLRQVAGYAGQNPTALCRNFKQSTGRSIFNCLLEIRIDFAYKLLVNSDFSIIQVAYESGFRNISHFNHKFKEMSGLSPLEYRRAHQGKSRTEYSGEELTAAAGDE